MLLVEDDVMVIVIKIRQKCVSPILVYGGAICESSPSGAQSRKVIHLRVGQDGHHLAQVECARKRYDLDRVSILQVSRCSWEIEF